MYKVLIIQGSNDDKGILRQLPPKFKQADSKYQFFINDGVENPDFVVVRNKYLKQTRTFNIAPENTILMLSEPRSILSFPKTYRNQFGMLYSCQHEISHRNVKYGPALLPWFVGVVVCNNIAKYSITYSDLKDKPFPEKTKLISVISSNKAFTKGHQDRIDFVQKLKRRYGDKIDVFGRGIAGFDDKWDVLAPYKYHISIENSSLPYYWTEKLSDCYLTGTYPIYYGCTNVNDYFPDDSLAKIDIHNFDAAIATIDRIIADNEFEKRQDTLRECQNLVLDKYNLFNIIAECCDSLNPDAPKQKVTLKPAVTMMDWHNIYLQVIDRNMLKIRKLFR